MKGIFQFLCSRLLGHVDASRDEAPRPLPKPYDCFILGSGRSLLELSQEEIAYIGRSPFVLAFNKYLLFQEKIGIVPTHYLLADSGGKALLTFWETARICERDPFRDVRFIFSRNLIRELRKQPEQESLLARSVKRAEIITRTPWLEGGAWALSLEDPIYHFRGSLSGAINVTSILNPGQRIKLLGVDLSDHKYFFQEEIDSSPEKWGIFLQRLTPESAQHETIVEVKDTAGIQDAFPFMEENVHRIGGELLCCNRESYLVTERILGFSPVIDLSSET